MSERESCGRGATESVADHPPVEITEFGGIRVAYMPGVDDCWISGWVDVPL